jgi:hypothetical protein
MIFSRKSSLARVTDGTRHLQGGPPRGRLGHIVNGAFSESFPTHAEALEAARHAAVEQRQPGQSETIEYEDEHGKWHTELALGSGRPETDVDDSA